MISELLLLTHPSPILGIRDKGVNKRRPLLGERQMFKKILNKIGNLKKKEQGVHIHREPTEPIKSG